MRFLDDRQVHQAAALGRDATVIGEPNEDEGGKECNVAESDQNRMHTRSSHGEGAYAREYRTVRILLVASLLGTARLQ